MSTNKVVELARLYQKQHGQNPPAAWLMDKTGLTLDQIKTELSKTSPVTPGPSPVFRVPQKQIVQPKPEQPEVHAPTPTPPAMPKEKHRRMPSIETLVLRFSHQLQYFGFFIAGFVDLGMSCFFYWSVGGDPFSKGVFVSWGVVQTASKVWGWTYEKVLKQAFPVALMAAILTIFGNTAILRAEFELQAKVAVANNAEVAQAQAQQSEADVIQKQITEKQAEIEKKAEARDKIDPTVEENLPMYRTLDNFVKASNKELEALRAALVAAQVREEAAKAAPAASIQVQEPARVLALDVWTIFGQWTGLDWKDHPRVLSYFFTMAIALLLELVLWATTPRKKELPHAV